MAVIELDYAPRQLLMPFHERHQRWAILVCHRRFGKTVGVINDMVCKAITERKPDGRYAYIAPYYHQAKQVAWDYLKYYARPLLAEKPSESELSCKLITGAMVRLYGADNPDSLRGIFLDGVALDEYPEMRPKLWGEVIRPLLADRKGWATFMGTPKGKNAFYELLEYAKGHPDWFSLVIKASESGVLDAEELEDARRTMTDDQYAQEFECSFDAAIVGAYYGRDLRMADEEGRIGAVDVDPALPVHTAWDLGYSDSTSIWFYQAIRGEIHIIDYYEANGESIAHYAKVLKDKLYRYGNHWLPHDARAKTLASGGRSIEEQLRAALGVSSIRIVPSLSLEDGIQAVRLMLGNAYFDKRCGEGIEALKQYRREWDDDKKAFRDKPRHDWTSHSADAFRMLAIAYREEKPAEKPKTIDFDRRHTLNELWAMNKSSGARI